MKSLFACADRYLRVCTWKDMALLKFCLASMGTLVGLCVPQRRKAAARTAAGLVFAVTYVPLMIRFFRVAFHGKREE